MLVSAFHRPLRRAVAAWVVTGVGLCAYAAVRSFARSAVSDGLAFVAVGIALSAVAVGVLLGVRWLLTVVAVAAARQLAAVVGTLWELAVGVAPGKAAQLRGMGVDPVYGVLINTAFSAVGVGLFAWLALRWYGLRAPAPK